MPDKLTKNNINYIPQPINQNVTREELLEKYINDVLNAENSVIDRAEIFKRNNQKIDINNTRKNNTFLNINVLLEEKGLSTEGTLQERYERLFN